MSDANYSSIAAQRETTWGVTPVSPALKLVRTTGETLAHSKETVVSEEVRSDRQTADLVEVGAGAAGAINFELSYDDFLHWWEAALFASAVTVALSGITANAVVSTQKIVGSAGNFDNVQAGSFVKVTGFSAAGNNGIKLVTAKAEDGSEITLAAGSLTANQTGATIAIDGKYIANGLDRFSYVIERGVRNYAGTKVYQRFAGMCVDQMTLNFESKAIITGSLTFIGKEGEVSDTSLMAATADAATGTLTLAANVSNDETITIGSKTYTFKTALTPSANEVLIGATASDSIDNLVAAINGAAGAGTLYGTGTTASTQVTAAAGAGDTMVVTASTAGTAGNAIATTETSATASFASGTLTGGTEADAYTAAGTDPVMNATSNVGSIYRDGATMSERFKTLALTIANGLRGRDAIGERGNYDIGVGSLNVTGSMSAYFRDNALLATFINHDDTSLGYTVTSGSGATLGIYLPRVKLSTGSPGIEGRDTDVMTPVEFQAIIDETIQKTIIVSLIDA